MAAPVTTVATVDDAPALAEIFLERFPQNDFDKKWLTSAWEGFIRSKEHGGQDARVFIIKNEEGHVTACILLWVVRAEDGGLSSWRKRWPSPANGDGDEMLDDLFTGFQEQHDAIMGQKKHVYQEMLLTHPEFPHKGHAVALVKHVTDFADELGYESYVAADSEVMPLYSKFGFATPENAEPTSFMLPMVRTPGPAKASS